MHVIRDSVLGIAAAALLGVGISQATAGSLYPTGAPVPTMKRLDQISPEICITSLPYTITKAGTYCLSSDLSGVAGENGILIAASDVVLDLKGFSLRGVENSFSGIALEGNQTNVTIKNGNVVNWKMEGVNSPSSPLRCIGLTSSNNLGSGFRLIAGGELIDCVAGGNTQDGCRAGGIGHTLVVKECRFNGNTGNGLSSLEAASLRCEDSSFDNNGLNGVLCRGGHLDKSSPKLMERCSASGNGGNGFEFDTVKSSDKTSPLLNRCVASGNGGSGLELKSTVTGVEMFRCESSVFSNNTSHGINLTPALVDGAEPVLVSGCVANGNGGNGINFSSAKSLDKSSPKLLECISSGNLGSGLGVNLTHGSLACRISLKSCTFEGNSSHGISVSGNGSAEGILDVACANVSSSGNGGDGLHGELSLSEIAGSLSGTGCVFSSNVGDGCRWVSGTPTITSNPKLRVVSLSAGSSSNNSGNGIYISNVYRTLLDGIDASSNGAMGIWDDTDIVHVRSCRTDGNVGTGIRMKAKERANMTKSFSSDNGGYGVVFLVEGLDDDCDGYIDECVASGNGLGGIRIGTARCVVTSCVSTANTGDGLQINSTGSGLILGNHCSNNSNSGVVVAGGQFELRDNTCPSNSASGIDITGGNGHIVRGNSVSNNAVHGIAVRTSGNLLYDNSSSKNTSPLYQEGDVINDISPSSSAAASAGRQNIGF